MERDERRSQGAMGSHVFTCLMVSVWVGVSIHLWGLMSHFQDGHGLSVLTSLPSPSPQPAARSPQDMVVLSRDTTFVNHHQNAGVSTPLTGKGAKIHLSPNRPRLSLCSRSYKPNCVLPSRVEVSTPKTSNSDCVR